MRILVHRVGQIIDVALAQQHQAVEDRREVDLSPYGQQLRQQEDLGPGRVN